MTRRAYAYAQTSPSCPNDDAQIVSPRSFVSGRPKLSRYNEEEDGVVVEAPPFAHRVAARTTTKPSTVNTHKLTLYMVKQQLQYPSISYVCSPLRASFSTHSRRHNARHASPLERSTATRLFSPAFKQTAVGYVCQPP